MNLYCISQSENDGYDTYDSAIVCAENEADAKAIHPDEAEDYYSWTDINNISVKLIGTADPTIKKGLVLASFNAG